jgi:poly-gamma-glutamate capsule biosynthesis protein CapA/YwtB (metallophosphatase superfamily)
VLTLLLLLATPTAHAGASTPTPPTLSVRGAGDVMLGTADPPGHLPPNDGADSLADVSDLLRDADLTFVNLEGPLCDEGESSKCGHSKNPCFAFRVPTRYGAYLADAGVDVASTANNHNGDFGDTCRRATERTLDSLGIAWSGAKGTVATLERKGLKIALIAFHTSAATNDVNDLPAARAIVKQAASTHDVVIVSFHGGAEGPKFDHVAEGTEMFFGENRGDLRAFAHAVVEAGADLVIGHGPHVLRGMELYQGRLIAYSLGNFATYGRFNLAGPQAIAAILHVDLAADGAFLGGRILPIHQVDQGLPRKDAQGRAIALIKKLSLADFGKSAPAISEAGEISRP